MSDSPIVRRWVLDANDGIISTTGIIQGFAGAGADDQTVLFAAMTLMITGGLSLGGAAFAEAAQDRAAQLTIVAAERDRLQRSPAEEREQLREHYVRRGVTLEVADEVAGQLMSGDALGAQLETEYGLIDGPDSAIHPWLVALRGFFGFVSGALPLTLAVVFMPEPFKLPLAIVVVIVSLTATGLVSSRAGTGTPLQTVIRSLTIGLFIAVLAYLAGNVFEIIDQFIPQIDVGGDVPLPTPGPS